MSIQSEITRITNKRNLSFIAVESKGVAVPTDATIDDLPDLIAQISGGGGGEFGFITQDSSGFLVISESAYPSWQGGSYGT